MTDSVRDVSEEVPERWPLAEPTELSEVCNEPDRFIAPWTVICAGKLGYAYNKLVGICH